jgi:hypothetical protein
MVVIDNGCDDRSNSFHSLHNLINSNVINSIVIYHLTRSDRKPTALACATYTPIHIYIYKRVDYIRV